MQRARIGLTGLSFVFVAVLLAAIFSRASDEEPITADRIDEAALERGMAPVEPGTADEPLAELGVAPGNAPDDAPDPGNATTADTVAVEDPLRPQSRR